MWKIKNDQWVSAIRYGIWFDNQSLEVVQFDFADGKTTYQVKVYDDTLFTWNITETFILDDLWKENIEKHGFLRTAQEYLTKKSKNQ